MSSPLFKQLVDGFAFGELPKAKEIQVTEEMVRLDDGTQVPRSKAAWLPMNGKMRWVRL